MVQDASNISFSRWLRSLDDPHKHYLWCGKNERMPPLVFALNYFPGKTWSDVMNMAPKFSQNQLCYASFLADLANRDSSQAASLRKQALKFLYEHNKLFKEIPQGLLTGDSPAEVHVFAAICNPAKRDLILEAVTNFFFHGWMNEVAFRACQVIKKYPELWLILSRSPAWTDIAARTLAWWLKTVEDADIKISRALLELANDATTPFNEICRNVRDLYPRRLLTATIRADPLFYPICRARRPLKARLFKKYALAFMERQARITHGVQEYIFLRPNLPKFSSDIEIKRAVVRYLAVLWRFNNQAVLKRINWAEFEHAEFSKPIAKRTLSLPVLNS